MFEWIRELLKGKMPQQKPVPARLALPEHVVPPATDLFTGATTETAAPRSRPPDLIKGNIDHAGHLRTLARNDEEMAKLCVDALASSRQRKIVMEEAQEISGYLSGESLLDIMTVTKNGQTVVAYPVFKAGSPWLARITQITECQDNYEGQLEIFLNGGTVTFFDALYFRNKYTYAPGMDARVLVSGIAYVMARGRSPSTEDDLLVRYEGGDVDDYVFRGTVQAVAEFTAFGRKARAIKTSARLGHEGQPVELWICVTASAMQERVAPGDRISGIVWLQGFVL